MRKLRRAQQKHARKNKKLKQRALAAGTATVITLGTAATLNKALAHTPDIHELPVSQDADADLLTNKEELAIGYRVFEPDQNRSAIPDGVELAKRCAADINDLPWQEDALPGQTYKWCEWQLGLETCDICGATVNMGPAGITNPKLGLSADCPLIAIHYMEHGSLSYAGDVHNGRLDVPLLMRVLELRYPYEPNEHQLPLDYSVDPNGPLAQDANDLDGDFLADSEELAAGYNLHDTDQDEDLIPDGIELAKQCAEIIEQLPFYDPFGEDPPPTKTYRWCGFQRGLEECHICGETVNMGPAGIVNPELGLEIECPLIALHYMSHGSFSYDGRYYMSGGEPLHNGRIDIALLMKILEMPRQCGDLGTIYLPGDLNKDCKENFADFADFADKWLQSTDPNQGDG